MLSARHDEPTHVRYGDLTMMGGGGVDPRATATSTATPTPTATPGGQSCPALPSFPDGTCTGVPSGETLTTVTGGVDLTTDGQTYSNKSVMDDCINIKADNITIQNVKTRCIYSGDGAINTTVVDTEVDGGNTSDNGRFGYCVEGPNLDMTRVDVHGCENDIGAFSNVSITDSYIHDVWYDGVVHADVIETAPGDCVPGGSTHVGPIDIEHSNLVFTTAGGSEGQTSVLNICNETGNFPHDITVNDSRLDATLTGYAVYCPRDGVNWSNIVITDNRMLTGTAGYGNDCSGHVTTWSGNVDDGTDATVNVGD